MIFFLLLLVVGVGLVADLGFHWDLWNGADGEGTLEAQEIGRIAMEIENIYVNGGQRAARGLRNRTSESESS